MMIFKGIFRNVLLKLLSHNATHKEKNVKK